MDRILIILKKENGPRASSAPALGLNTIIFKYVYWYMKQISGERLHWSSGLKHVSPLLSVALSCNIELRTLPTEDQSFTVKLICHNKINILLLI